jgi:tetratricopeptide (TPR) repeat protein
MDLSFMKLDALSPKIALFTRLRRLDLKGNSLETLPSEIGDLTGLEELDLRLNRIKYLPPQIMNLTGLRYLYITANRLSRDELKRLEQQLPFTTIINSPSTIVRDKKTRPSPFSRPELARSDSLDIRCRAGNEQACHHLGDLYANHRDYERALIAYTAGCDLSSPTASAAAQSSCTRAGDIYHYILKNRDRAVQYYEHVCKHIGDNTGEACERLHTVLRRR